MERGLSLSYPQCSIVILFLPHSSPLTNPSLHLSQKPNFSSHLSFSQRRWDSNAETFRTLRSKFNFRDTADEDDDDDDDEEDFQEMEPGSGLLEEFIDSFWILKVKEFHCSFRICELELKFADFRYMENDRSSVYWELLSWSLVVLFLLSVCSGIVFVRVWECFWCFGK